MWIFTSIFGIANTLALARDKILAVADKRTETVAAYFDRLADTTELIRAELAEGRIPYEQVARLRASSSQFSSIVGGLLPDEQVRLMAEDLAELNTPEELLRLYSHPDHGVVVVWEISEAIGIFRGLADALRARV